MAFGIDDAVAAGLQIINKFIPDPAQREQAEAALRQSFSSWDDSQNKVNAAEASNPNMFVAGWRPAVGWVCASAFFWNFVGAPIAGFIGAALMHPIPLPNLDVGPLMTILVGMLGMGGMRTYEKLKGVHNQH